MRPLLDRTRRRHGSAAGIAVDIPVLRAGVLAQEFCRRGNAAWVDAVFDRSFYLVSGATFVCVGTPAIGNGPLTLIADLESGRLSALSPGRPAAISERHIAIGDDLRLNLDRCEPWQPPPWPAVTPAASLIEGAVARRFAGEAPPEGLAGAVAGTGPLARIAAPRLALFESWLSEALGCDDALASAAREAVSPLIGLGPGLTPSGDDFLSGALALLDALGERDVHAAMARAIVAAAPALTSPLSACLLRAARAGHIRRTPP